MEQIFEKKFFKALQRFGEKMAGSKVFSAIAGGLQSTMGFILAGAIFQIIVIMLDLFKAAEEGGALHNFLMMPVNMTIGVISVIVAYGIAYMYARVQKMKSPMSCGIVSLILFMMVAAPVQTVILENGETMTVMDMTGLGSIGLFTAFLIALISVKITKLCTDKKIAIRLPDAVPSIMADAFTSIIPLTINILLFHGLNSLVMAATGVTLPLIITGIFTMIFGAVSSLGGVIFITVAAMILWLLGIHGTSVVFVVCMPLYMQVILENGALVAAGQDPVFHPILLVLLHTAIGGAGGTLGLVILGMRSKSAQIKAVSKAGIVPSLFSINEPVTFGMPIVYNPILAIPYILTPVVVIILYWIGYSTGFLVPPYVLILTFMPIGMVDFFGSLSWTNAIFPFLLIPVSLLMYYPFFKIYEKQLLKKEAAVNETVK